MSNSPHHDPAAVALYDQYMAEGNELLDHTLDVLCELAKQHPEIMWFGQLMFELDAQHKDTVDIVAACAIRRLIRQRETERAEH